MGIQNIPLDVDRIIFGVRGALAISAGVDERLVADPPFNRIGVWDLLDRTVGDEGGVAGGRLCNTGDALKFSNDNI